MAAVSKQKDAFSVKAYRGDAKTLLAFNLTTAASRKSLAGFTIQVTPPGKAAYYLLNNLRFEIPGNHAQDPQEPAASSLNAPFQKFRWVHVTAKDHQGLNPAFGTYTYTVTPRYFDAQGSMQPADPKLSVSVKISVDRFSKGKLAVGFTRGFVQSQAFVRHFGLNALIRPKGKDLLFKTSQPSGTNAAGENFTYADQYQWLGWTARDLIFDLLDEVAKDKTLSLDIFAYDLNEPDIIQRLLALGKEKRVRIILDNAALHHDTKGDKPEDEFEALFAKRAGQDAIWRGHFGRYSHDKVFIVSDKSGAKKVLTGSTNFSVTGLYVNSNHVLVFNDADVAKTYAAVFEESWNDNTSKPKFVASDYATEPYVSKTASVPKTSITFSPHSEEIAADILGGLVQRINKEGKSAAKTGSVLFAVMELGGGPNNPVYSALCDLHKNQNIFSYGISDTPKGIALYPLGKKTGVLVTGKPGQSRLPPPFDQVPGVGAGHQIHHKFVVCGFNGPNPVVYCGSSNLALGGEQANGDNLLAISDEDVATVFAIEALELVDHFDFLDRTATVSKAKKPKKAAAVGTQAAVSAGWFLKADDAWAAKYYDPNDLHSVDRKLFAG
ncbi:phospholipase D-like domain-containing protein [Methyloferula stellata]|uniref:phospholipase D-like domain-containing protein n=1 Tax=Methyloferula stellata TaxID=876270 RepID=UPI00036E6786|nr:phospholipase D-like domain-containing protein [Methyloferula stellata]